MGRSSTSATRLAGCTQVRPAPSWARRKIFHTQDFQAQHGLALISRDPNVLLRPALVSAPDPCLAFSLHLGVTKSGASRRAMMAFDVGRAIPLGSTINSASLRLYMDRMSPQWTTPSTYSFHRLTTAFGEGTSFVNNGQGAPASAGDSTWNEALLGETPWTTAGGDFVSPAAATGVLEGTSTTPGVPTKSVRACNDACCGLR